MSRRISVAVRSRIVGHERYRPPNVRAAPVPPRGHAAAREIFRASIEELTADDYSESQQEAWAFSGRTTKRNSRVGLKANSR
jgi:hypothetical protein